MRQTVVGVFERYATARQAAQQLRESGFGDSVTVTDEVALRETGELEGDAAPRYEGGFLAQVRDFFADLFDDNDKEVSPYAEALRRGGGVVKVEVEADSAADAAREALEAAGAIDIDEQASGWRASGWRQSPDPVQQPTADLGERPLGDAARETPMTTVDAAPGAVQGDPVSGTGEGSAARKSAVRVYPRGAQRPIEDAIETAPPDLPADNASAPPVAGYQSHFDANYASGGGQWQDYEPAYRYGDELRSDTRYTGRAWDEVEPDLRSDWAARNAGPWEKFKGAIRHAWERVAR
jgi:hypothetical protein